MLCISPQVSLAVFRKRYASFFWANHSACGKKAHLLCQVRLFAAFILKTHQQALDSAVFGLEACLPNALLTRLSAR